MDLIGRRENVYYEKRGWIGQTKRRDCSICKEGSAWSYRKDSVCSMQRKFLIGQTKRRLCAPCKEGSEK